MRHLPTLDSVYQVLLVLVGCGLVGVGVVVGRNSQTLSRRLGGTLISPRTDEARDGVLVLLGVFCVIIGIAFVGASIAQML